MRKKTWQLWLFCGFLVDVMKIHVPQQRAHHVHHHHHRNPVAYGATAVCESETFV